MRSETLPNLNIYWWPFNDTEALVKTVMTKKITITDAIQCRSKVEAFYNVPNISALVAPRLLSLAPSGIYGPFPFILSARAILFCRVLNKT